MAEGKPLTIEGWPKGINNILPGTLLGVDFARDALNVDLDDGGKPHRRRGYTLVQAGSNVHSIAHTVCGLVYADGRDLRRLLPDESSISIYPLSTDEPISYVDVNQVTYFSNGVDFLKLDVSGSVSPNGVESPGGQPTLNAHSSYGSLPAGRYLLAVRFVDSRGEVSGASLETYVDLSSPGAIGLSNIPQNARATAVQVFCTEPNGSLLRYQLQLPMGVTSATLMQVTQGKLLDTQFMGRLPAGRIVRYYKGRMLSASGGQLFYSPAMRYGLCDLASGYFALPGEITMVQPVEGGIFVSSDKTYFLSGADPAEARAVVVSDYPAIPGTGACFPGSDFGFEDGLDVAYWVSREGAVIGAPGGTIKKLTEESVALPSYDAGTSFFRESNGMRHAVTALRGSGAGAQLAVGDEVEVTVKRNGIIL